MVRFSKAQSVSGALKYLVSEVFRDDLTDVLQAEAGLWFGKGAERLGLSGAVTREQFARIASNVHPTEETRLSDRSSPNRPAGWHVTVDFPKSTSVMSLVQSDAEVFGAAIGAGGDGMREAETRAGARVRKDGADENRVTGEVVAAAFIHRTARTVEGNSDPQLHLHVFFFNQTFDAVENKWKALQVRSMWEDAPVIEHVIRSSLMQRLQNLGYELELRGDSWEIAGVSRAVVERFSNRTKQIQEEAAARGITDPSELDGLGARTRESKSAARAYSDMRAEWASRLSPEELVTLEAIKVRAQERSGRHEEIRVPGFGEAWTRRENHTQHDGTEREQAQKASPEQEHSEQTREDKKTKAEQHRARAEQAASEQYSDAYTEEPRTTRLNRRQLSQLDEAIYAAVGVTFERNASVPERVLLDAGFKTRIEGLHLEDVRESIARQGVLTRVLDGRRVCTSKEALAEESAVLDLANRYRGHYLSKTTEELGPLPKLTVEQRQAVHAVLSSPDLVMMVRGGAGVGKTRLTSAAVQQAWEHMGVPVCMLAPTARAARVVLREEGHKAADTVAKFLASEDLQKKAKGGIIWVDEAALMGTKDLKALLQRGVDLHARVVLMGDDRQHKAVTRCGWLTALIDYAAMKVATVDGVMRQAGAYKEIVEHMSSGRFETAVAKMKELGAIRELPRDTVLRAAAAEYAKMRAMGESVVMVGQTHRQIAEVTGHVREYLRDLQQLKGQDRSVMQLKSKFLTEFERGRSESYQKGDVVEFHKRVTTLGAGVFERKSRWEVVSHDPFGNVIVKNGMLPRALPLSKSAGWDVYTKSQIEVAAGDLIRITNTNKVRARSDMLLAPFLPSRRDPSHEVNNGEVHEVSRVTRTGKIILQNGKILGKDFAHISHSYCVTSYIAQAMTTDRVVALMTSDSGLAASQENFYVACSRGRHSLRVYTDSVVEMQAALEKSRVAPSATKVAAEGEPVNSARAREQEQARRFQDYMRAQAAAEAAAREQERARAHAR